MQLTDFEIFWNTPFNDFQNTIHFDSNAARDKFFDSAYSGIKFSKPFNMVKDRLTVHAPTEIMNTYGANYCRFKNDIEMPGEWYYAFIMEATYINDRVTDLSLVIDTVMTFTQGNFVAGIENAYVTRQSLDADGFNHYKNWLTHNSDVLLYPKEYRHQVKDTWDNLAVVFQCSADLQSDYGSGSNPKLKTSKGQTRDGITSPVNLYVCRSVSDFNSAMGYLSDYPWISQNVNNVALVPLDFIEDSDITSITGPVGDWVWSFHDGTFTKTIHIHNAGAAEAINSKTDFGFPENAPAWLTRADYANIEVTAYAGQVINIDPTFLPAKGLDLVAQATMGYHNEIKIFPDAYQSGSEENSVTGLYKGTYANNALIFDQFDDIPVLVDNYKLAKASNAHQRELGNARTITGQYDTLMGRGAAGNSLQDRFQAAVSMVSNFSPANLMGKFTDEYDHYRDQKAELADKAISAPSVGSQNNSQSFNIAHKIYGAIVKYASIGSNWKQVVRYHASFGFDFGGQVAPIYSITSMPLMNFLKFSGNWQLENVPTEFMAQLKLTFENGVKLWKPNGTNNPFTQDIMGNYPNLK